MIFCSKTHGFDSLMWFFSPECVNTLAQRALWVKQTDEFCSKSVLGEGSYFLNRIENLEKTDA
jgi:hypothetical protein